MSIPPGPSRHRATRPTLAALGLCGALIGVSAAGLASADPLELQLQQTRLELEVALDYDAGALEGRATLTVENVSAHPASEVPLLLGRLMTIRRALGDDGKPLELDQDVVSFADWPELQVNHARVRLPDALPPGGTTTLSVAYSGWVVPYTETGMLYVRDRIAEEFSILRADAFSFPVLGLPSDEANRALPLRDFDFRVAVTAPERFTVANGGKLIARTTANGSATWVYESVGPAPFVFVTVADYRLLEERGVRVFSFPDDVDGGARLLASALRAMDLMAEWFGPLPGPPEVAVMEIPEDWGSQASLYTGILQTASAFRRPERSFELYHELSHLWNAPDIESPSPRWNEGLAVFLQFRLAETLDGWQGMEDEVDTIAARVLRTLEETPSYQGVPFSAYGERGMTDLSYGTGFLMFYLLDRLMGTEALYQALRAHFQSHHESGGSFEDLATQLRAASPRPLDPFLRDWLSTTGWQERWASSGSAAALLESYRAPEPGN